LLLAVDEELVDVETTGVETDDGDELVELFIII
jgi:hypothetical protein